MTTGVAERAQVTISDRIVAAKLGINGSLDIFAKAVHGMDLEQYQLAWEDLLESEDRTGIVCPPDTFKSTTVQLWIERAIARDPNIRILWLMNAGEQAEKRVMSIASTIESNTVYRTAFTVIPDKGRQWTKSVLYVERERDSPDPTLMGCGLNGPYQGLHFDIIIIDDPTNQEDVRSPTTMELQVSKIRGVVIDRLVEGGRIVFILTRWGENDLVPTFRIMEFAIINMPVLSDKYPWGPTISPRRFPLSKIEALRRDKGDALFQLTYMCNASALTGNIIHRDHIRYWDNATLPLNPLSIYIGVDPAAGERTFGDPSSIATVGIDVRTSNMYLLDMFDMQISVPNLELEIVRRSRIAGLRAIGVETIAFQLSLVQYLKRNHKLPLVEIPYRSRRQAMHKVLGVDRDKVSRAMYLDSLFISGRLYIPRNLPLYNGVSIEAELTSIPTGDHDDRMDSLCFACTLADVQNTNRPKVSLRAF